MAVASESAASQNAAARESARRKTRTAAVGGETALAIGLLVFGWNWVRDTRAALAYRRRELTPWERAERGV